ncbi:phenylacetate-coenzyme A ligase [Virgibacillus pantothenticus]|uniref:Phenylacetate-coenzyme A ligase n=2 Tax=Virgibacillus pantothenticus TaxID=1473 RepID=A0A0L0QMH1_VIRPA|nr:AMP-binding protein [Virgibacillus pantothenticus]KNE19458.1 phenylacetate--CoA ligase [Virgibacillus pantothenticus]MBU8568800.1 AMP-binding protein [Virgibacillus pantothenticus]MBU8602852.1 AMP-binding protein [Virgibacillus pantothenticus]MBU8636931.1 AMP-binding protein [Virgibacillus pantothenticus]MBU8644686.1 AMP-binding protein [Virgibacillus pantothenticus]
MFFNEIMETLSKQEMEKIQLSRLQQTVRTVYNKTPFYQKKFTELNVKPNDIQSLEDIRKLPFTQKKDLRDNYPFDLFALPISHVERIHASSGTSGKPTVVGYTRNDLEVWAEIVARAIAACGGEPDSVLQNTFGYGLFTGGLGLHYGSEKLGMATVPVSGGNTERQILLIEDFKPTVIVGTPSYILNIADKMEQLGKDARDTSLKYGIFGAEPWSEEMRKELEKRLGIKAMDIYGLSEVMGPGISFECLEAQCGLHVADDHFFIEVIDPDTLEPVAEGEEGELVFTSLTKEAFPIIRYRTGDIASITSETCICGRTTTRMSRVKGRIDDMLIIRGVNVYPSEVESALLELEELVPHYQLYVVNQGALDKVILKVEINESIYNNLNRNLEHETIKALANKVFQQLKSKCLISVDINIEHPGSIPRSGGKAIRIVRDTKMKV